MGARWLVEQGVAGRLLQLEGGLPLMAPGGTPEVAVGLGIKLD